MKGNGIDELMNPSLRYPHLINPEKDAERLNKAIKLLGPDEDVINEILGHRSFQQRMEIAQVYKRFYKKELVDSLGSVLVGEYDHLVRNLFRSPIEILAHDIHRGLKSQSNCSHSFNEILCCLTNTEIYLLGKAYDKIIEAEDPKALKHRSLEMDILKETKGSYKLFMHEILKAQRCEDDLETLSLALAKNDINLLISNKLVEDDVLELYEAGEKQELRGDPAVFISILTKRSRYHIRSIWNSYKNHYGRSLVQVITEKFPNPLRSGLNTMLMALIDLQLLMVCQLYCSMEKLGTNEDFLTRIICLRCEVDLQDIKNMYEKYFYKSLANSINSDTSGGFRKLLLYLIGEPISK